MPEFSCGVLGKLASNGQMAITRLKRAIWLLIGWVLLVAGIVGLFLPFPGFALIVLGLLTLSSEYVWANNLIGRLRGRFPKTVNAVEKYSGRATSAD
ncbi:hypothetical protein Acid345_0629 [Candidatus Koribacter versatilis Ellin345]|uniref:Transmembrane protein (PGPGW) n=2 Tax=Candidatus Korobacter versatilis TaxID=658062 RepID=Q1IU16_KORVE|nr:hypothetical protein Acid345_0629 [Candidatus Koribacter versatilis Ellin345]